MPPAPECNTQPPGPNGLTTGSRAHWLDRTTRGPEAQTQNAWRCSSLELSRSFNILFVKNKKDLPKVESKNLTLRVCQILAPDLRIITWLSTSPPAPKTTTAFHLWIDVKSGSSGKKPVPQRSAREFSRTSSSFFWLEGKLRQKQKTVFEG